MFPIYAHRNQNKVRIPVIMLLILAITGAQS
jgi:hypothetical protein